MKKQYIVTFHTHYEALCCKRAFEQRLHDKQVGKKPENNEHSKNEGSDEYLKIETKLIPVPRALSSSCGTALNVEVGDEARFDITFLFDCEHDEIYTVDDRGQYHLEDESYVR